MSPLNNEEIVGVTAEEMTVADLKVLCAENNLDIKGLSKKADILKVVKKWEKKILKENEERLKARGEEIVKNATKKRVITAKEDPIEIEFHEGKQVVSKVPVTHNGTDYHDITVEGGITYRVRK